MGTFLRIVALMAKYGSRAVGWCWDNKSLILKWIERNIAISTIIDWILDRLGIKH